MNRDIPHLDSSLRAVGEELPSNIAPAYADRAASVLLRSVAEELLSDSSSPEIPAYSTEELLHELQVHQTELKMQNETLREALQALEESHDRFVDLYEFAPVGYLTLNPIGLITEINLTGVALLGYERKKLFNKSLRSLVMAADQDRWSLHFTHSRKCMGKSSIDVSLKRVDGTVFQAQLDCVSNSAWVRITMKDITEAKQMMESLRKSRQLLDSIVENIPAIVFVKSAHDLRIELCNRTGEELLGCTRNDMLGKGNYDLWSGEQADRFTATDRKALASEEGLEIPEETIQTPNGETLYLQTWKFALRDDEGKPTHLLDISIDISKQKLVNQQLNDLATHLQMAREEEKACIAREIHDELGGTLTALKMAAYSLAEEIPLIKDSEKMLKHIELISFLTENAVQVARRVITGLRPSILDDLGLLAALEWQAAEFQKQTGIPCRVNRVDDKANPCRHHSIALFRIFQEALTNVAKHSGATRVQVEYFGGEEEIMLSISDNGCGLPDEQAFVPTSYGIRGMRERIQQLGGQLKLDRPPGGGVCVMAILHQQAYIRNEPRT